ncbi:MAG: serine/threonine protein kinase, partial [Acidimicrobiaceae bacterium]|nr:serine/threonine protein kinase [Acidimicrobiaceae bacterium]
MLRRRPTPSDGLLDLPGYTDLSVIGNGSSGVVYRAYQPRLDRVVAIKVVLADLSGGDLLARWERECRATGRLSRHPYIVTVLDAGVSPAGRPYLVMDWYPQGSLAASLHARGPMPIAKVLTLGVKLCGALETAHRTGILHRDVKPENVLLDELGEPALADFGIAGIAGTATAQLGPRALTPVHAAPEVLDDRPASPASDVYALGSVLYTALAGRAAYEAGSGEGFAALLARILTQPLPPIGRADVPAALEEAVSWAMAKDPAARPASAAALGQRLQQIQVQLEEAPADLVITAPAGTGRGAGFPPDGAAPPRTTTPPNGAAHPTGAAPTNDAALPAGAAPPNGAAGPDDRIQIGGSTVERPARRDRDAPLPPLGSPAPTSSTPPPGAP